MTQTACARRSGRTCALRTRAEALAVPPASPEPSGLRCWESRGGRRSERGSTEAGPTECSGVPLPFLSLQERPVWRAPSVDRS